jgi:hypothetical protein
MRDESYNEALRQLGIALWYSVNILSWPRGDIDFGRAIKAYQRLPKEEKEKIKLMMHLETL